MVIWDDPLPKPVRWIGSSRQDVRDFPETVRLRIGGALWEAQTGGKAAWAKPLHGFGGAGVLEIVDDDDGDTYRAVYSSISQRGLCPARLPEEVKKRHRHAASRNRADRATSQARARGS
jgi:hypothetical protein